MHLCCKQFLTIPGVEDRRRGPQRHPGARQVQLVASAQMERQHREDGYDGGEGCQCSFLRGPCQVHLSLPSESHGGSHLRTCHCASGVHPGQASKNSSGGANTSLPFRWCILPSTSTLPLPSWEGSGSSGTTKTSIFIFPSSSSLSSSSTLVG